MVEATSDVPAVARWLATFDGRWCWATTSTLMARPMSASLLFDAYACACRPSGAMSRLRSSPRRPTCSRLTTNTSVGVARNASVTSPRSACRRMAQCVDGSGQADIGRAIGVDGSCPAPAGRRKVASQRATADVAGQVEAARSARAPVLPGLVLAGGLRGDGNQKRSCATPRGVQDALPDGDGQVHSDHPGAPVQQRRERAHLGACPEHDDRAAGQAEPLRCAATVRTAAAHDGSITPLSTHTSSLRSRASPRSPSPW